MEEFLNTPSYIWKGIFSLAKVLGTSIIQKSLFEVHKGQGNENFVRVFGTLYG